MEIGKKNIKERSKKKEENEKKKEKKIEKRKKKRDKRKERKSLSVNSNFTKSLKGPGASPFFYLMDFLILLLGIDDG